MACPVSLLVLRVGPDPRGSKSRGSGVARKWLMGVALAVVTHLSELKVRTGAGLLGSMSCAAAESRLPKLSRVLPNSSAPPWLRRRENEEASETAPSGVTTRNSTLRGGVGGVHLRAG